VRGRTKQKTNIYKEGKVMGEGIKREMKKE
jgi:hypothetical protein